MVQCVEVSLETEATFGMVLKFNMWVNRNLEFIAVFIIGISIHLLLLISVFDTYFQSPLEYGMVPVKSTDNPGSKRTVLFVADGLRAQAVLNENENRTPFLTSVRKNRGSWGISHTRVPTESRPGHVAILAGIYEDPSAIFKGWKHNPVDFDSVINQSRNAWCIGSPDIVPIFNKDNRKHVHIHSYDAELEDFGNKNTMLLDNWVFEKTEWILNTFKNSEAFEKSGNIFFLHLLGLDTAGHAFKPFSKEYIDNINFVDKNIERLEKLFNEIFTDGLTSYIFTADHGMTNWGSHGSGLDHETFTPIIVWGAGVKKDEKQKDIKQIDIAPLMSSLIGINYPSNNLGQLPIDYLDISDSKKLYCFLSNIQQIFQIFNVKQQRIEKSTFHYKPYKYLTSHNFEKNFTELWHTKESFDITFGKCEVLFNEILKAIEYCHNYFMSYILFSVSLGLFFWMAYLTTFLFLNHELECNKPSNFVKLVPLSYNFLVILMCSLQSFPLTYYLYFLFPGTVFYFLLDRIQVFSKMLSFKLNVFKCVYFIFFCLCIVVFIYGFTFRFCFSIMMILISFSVFLNPQHSQHIDRSLKLYWIQICWVLAIFPLLPLMSTKFQIIYFILGYIFWQLFSYFIIRKEFKKFKSYDTSFSRQESLFFLQKLAFNISFFNSLLISFDIFENSSVLKYFSWFLFLVPLLAIPFSIKSSEIRIFTIILSFGPFYLMTTMSYELIFLTFYCILLILWMKIESHSTSQTFKDFENFRKCVIFVSLILIGFFGTGNIASLNSFDPMWVRCFLTVFSPFKMTILIFLKLILPFLFTACVFRNIILKTNMNFTNSFCVILLISDVMVFYFLHNIKNVGSWLEIGMSLSHFIVVECLTLGILLLYFAASVFTNVWIDESFLRKFKLPGTS